MIEDNVQIFEHYKLNLLKFRFNHNHFSGNIYESNFI